MSGKALGVAGVALTVWALLLVFCSKPRYLERDHSATATPPAYAGAVVAPAPVPDPAPRPGPQLKTQWFGHVAFWFKNDQGVPTVGWMSKVEIGMREDGVLLWRSGEELRNP